MCGWQTKCEVQLQCMNDRSGVRVFNEVFLWKTCCVSGRTGLMVEDQVLEYKLCVYLDDLSVLQHITSNTSTSLKSKHLEITISFGKGKKKINTFDILNQNKIVMIFLK